MSGRPAEASGSGADLVIRPAWLDDRRVYLLALFAAALMLAVTALFVFVLIRNVAAGEAHILDFTAFWAAAAMTVEGRPALAYDWAAHRAVQEAAIGGSFAGHMPWHYPPTFQLAVAPLGLLPVGVAHALWVAGTLALYLGVVHRILPGRSAVLAAMVPAPVLMLAVNGQTGFLIPALTGVLLLGLRARPGLAGVALGLLTLKPHLGIAFPVALVALGRWRVLAVGALTAGALAAASLVALGAETWLAFFGSFGDTSAVFTEHDNKWHLVASLYGRLRLAGLDAGPALAAQAVLSAAVAIVLVRALRMPGLAPDVGAALIGYAAIAIAPRVLDYDLLTLYVAALFQIRHARRAGFFPGEILVLGLALAGPLLDLVLPDEPGAALSEVNFLLAPMLMAALLLGERRREAWTAREPAHAPRAA